MLAGSRAYSTELLDKVYVDGTALGAGSFGSVVAGYLRDSGTPVAVKIITSSDQELSSSAVREIGLLRELRHPNIVPLRDVVIGRLPLQHDVTSLSRWQVAFVFERAEEDVSRVVSDPLRVFDLDWVRGVMRQLLHATLYLHRAGFVHRDIKPQNCLLKSDPAAAPVGFGAAPVPRVWLTDFGQTTRYASACLSELLTRRASSFSGPQLAGARTTTAAAVVPGDFITLWCEYGVWPMTDLCQSTIYPPALPSLQIGPPSSCSAAAAPSSPSAQLQTCGL